MAHGSPVLMDRPLVVIVEGDDSVRSGLLHTLQQDGCRVLAARDCRTAISLVSGLDVPVHLIITNISVTYIEGHALLENLARAHHHPPLLFFSTQAPPSPHWASIPPPMPDLHAPAALRAAVHRLLGLQHRETRDSEETA
jgi:DNA-binding NtrC family response regulator